MKIGLYVQRVASAPGFEDVVSAHVQLPLHTMELLRASGHDVQLITTEFDDSHTLPSCLPKGITIHKVAYGSRQGTSLVMHVGRRKGIRPFAFVKQLHQLERVTKLEQYGVLHLFGSHKLVYLASALKSIGVRTPIVLTMDSGSLARRFWFATRHLWKSIAAVITSTDFFRSSLADHGIAARTIKHGVVRDMAQEVRQSRANYQQHRVLFWRDPSIDNGADICLQVYEQLAPRFPFLSFDLAVRPHWEPVAGLPKLCGKYPNVHLYEFPYKQGITISRLLAESICVLLPFRRLDTHPQLVILESMSAGIPVITTALDSNLELIDSESTGCLVPVGDVAATAKAVEKIIVDPKHATQIGDNAAQAVKNEWNWTKYVPELVNVYSQLIARKSDRPRVVLFD